MVVSSEAAASTAGDLLTSVSVSEDADFSSLQPNTNQSK